MYALLALALLAPADKLKAPGVVCIALAPRTWKEIDQALDRTDRTVQIKISGIEPPKDKSIIGIRVYFNHRNAKLSSVFPYGDPYYLASFAFGQSNKPETVLLDITPRFRILRCRKELPANKPLQILLKLNDERSPFRPRDIRVYFKEISIAVR